MNAGIEFFNEFINSEGVSIRWTGFHAWLYTLSNVAIWLAFFALGAGEYYLIRKRKDISYKKIIWLFIFFIGFFGLTYLLDALTFWFPIYEFAAYVKFITALVAWGTLIGLLILLPKMLTMKSQNQLKETIEEQTSELNLTNKKLRESERQFRILVNNHPDSISQLDKDLKYVFVNKTILELTGAPEAFFVGKTIYELDFPESFIKEQEYHLRNAFEKGTFAEFEAVSELPQIGPRTFKITFVPVRNEAGKVETVMNIATDVTRQREFEHELNENIHELQELSENLITKNKQLQDFAYIVSHNLRSPMSNLMALVSLYENEKQQEQRDFLVKKIGEVTRSFSQTIDELTEVVKIRQEISLEFQENKFETLVAHIKTILDTQIMNAKAIITCDFSGCETIRYPKVYIESILLNLITNAIKYRSDKRVLQIHLAARIENETVCFTCQDNGLGLDLKKFGDKIFGMNKTFHPNSDSRGMGLFITKNQIESLGGTISMESKPDQGSIFTIVF